MVSIYSSLGAGPGSDPEIPSLPEVAPRVPPKLPARAENPLSKPVYNLKSPLATILMYRQSDLRVSLTLSSVADVYMNEKVDLQAKITPSVAENDEFWSNFVQNYNENYVREHNSQEIEEKVLLGVPEALRGAVYMSILNVEAIVESQTYDSLVKKAKLADFEGGKKEIEPHLTDQSELVQVFWYCLKGTAHTNPQAIGLLSSRFIESLARLLGSISGSSKAEALMLLFKLTEQISQFSKREFAYKGSRALEDLNREQFLHVTKQGIDLLSLFETVFDKVFDFSLGKDHETEPGMELRILDLFLLEGPDYLLRLMCAVFSEQKEAIMHLDGDKLNEFLHSRAFFALITTKTLQESVGVEIPIIKYENEFSLMNVNSISGNDNEVSILQEMHEELRANLSELEEKYTQLQTTHEEIFGQNTEYASKLSAAREEKDALVVRKEALQQKYNQLTMQENLGNTIKANTDISRENLALEQQIEAMKKKVEAKSKLVK